jgi:hypothetical protein
MQFKYGILNGNVKVASSTLKIEHMFYIVVDMFIAQVIPGGAKLTTEQSSVFFRVQC